VPVKRVGAWERAFVEYLDAEGVEILEGIRSEKVLSEEIEARLKEALEDFNARFLPEIEATAAA